MFSMILSIAVSDGVWGQDVANAHDANYSKYLAAQLPTTTVAPTTITPTTVSPTTIAPTTTRTTIATTVRPSTTTTILTTISTPSTTTTTTPSPSTITTISTTTTTTVKPTTTTTPITTFTPTTTPITTSTPTTPSRTTTTTPSPTATPGTVAHYDQCGGIGWNGGTGCVAAWTCIKSNDYAFERIRGRGLKYKLDNFNCTSKFAPFISIYRFGSNELIQKYFELSGTGELKDRGDRRLEVVAYSRRQSVVRKINQYFTYEFLG
ncbi:carbohydrate-binding module family 1 protein [Sphaerobolus stellatus SS14]|uniref:Carbohydrate-binding module family 1 protein n=1 Tax=Sphaerobolus stellatus (strain SS14) TaxID=990650 RepID=A0A0C9VQ79_SPHS4|nr:carbohydrate-binding module family 1 protein [Sphaerobolus stellatus SS14]